LSGLVQSRQKLRRHLVEALCEALPEAVVAIAQRRAHVADDAAPFDRLATAQHLLNGIDSPVDSLKRILSAFGWQLFLDSIE
jgi:hypothetical protein